MSGTSLDGVDFSYLETNGTDYVKIIAGKSYEYSQIYKSQVNKIIKQIQSNILLPLAKIDFLISKQFLYMTKKFIKEFNINSSNIDYIGLSGQTILHQPDKNITIQLGSGRFLSNNLKINIVSNFRDNDILNGGQGAPIGAFYHKYLSNRLKKNIVFINLGGIANICYSNNENLIAFDTGPGNTLIDQFIWLRLKKHLDFNGNLSFKGKADKKLIKEFLNDEYFEKNFPKSLDREYFNHFLNKTKKLSVEDGICTLSMFTVHGIKKGLDLLNRKIDQIILTGGGRKNIFIFNKLKDITNLTTIDIDDLGFNGDLLEAEAFGYLAVRSVKKLPLSLITTTGVKVPVTGGMLYKVK